jgi:hypothetical protein
MNEQGPLAFAGVPIEEHASEFGKWEVVMPGPLRLFTMVPAI